MESPLTQIQIPPGHSLDEWNQAYAKVERYLTALRLRNKFLLGQYVYRILDRATRRARTETAVAPTELAMEEAVKAINDWVGQVLGTDVADTPHRIATQGRLAMLLADVPGKMAGAFPRPRPVAGGIRQGDARELPAGRAGLPDQLDATAADRSRADPHPDHAAASGRTSKWSSCGWSCSAAAVGVWFLTH